MTVSGIAGAAAWPRSDDYAADARRRSIALAVGGLVVAVGYAAAIISTQGSLVVLVPLFATLVGLAVCVNPIIGVYLLLAAALLFEQWPIVGIDPLTARLRLFQNVSAYTPLPLRLSVADLLVLLTVASWAIRGMLSGRPWFRLGPLGWAVVGYGAAFGVGTAIGLARGGAFDADAALAELRGPMYVCVSYFLAANLLRSRSQLAFFIAEFVLLVAVKAAQGIANYTQALDLPYSLEAVTSHEDVVFFDVAIALAIVALLLGLRTRFAYFVLALQPVIITAELLTQRRVGFVSLGAATAALFFLSFARDVRRGLLFGAIGLAAMSAYVVVFADNNGPLGEPIRAMRSVLDPSSVSVRDMLSDSWRDIENRNIEYTVGQLPLTGVGVGQQYLFAQEPSTLWGFTYWRFMTHNALLWIWLKAGPVGAFALWFLVARALLASSAQYVRLTRPWLRWAAVFPVVLLVSQIVFSSVDLGLTYSRTCLVLGMGLGLSALLGDLATRERQDTRVAT